MQRLLLLPFLFVLGCGARTGAALDDEPLFTPFDGGMDAALPVDAGPDAPFDAGTDAPAIDAGCIPTADACVRDEICGNGSDDDCNGLVDEGCPCEVGSVQDCFAGAPSRRNVGACQDGSQVCESDGAWGPCEGGILPNPDVCTGRDDLCDGCSDQRICEIDCPSPGDPRVPVGVPFDDYTLDARQFYVGPATAFLWTVEGGPCDDLAPRLRSYELTGARSAVATLVPRLSGDYRVTLRVETPGGGVLECSWVVHVEGPGLRVEMCYPESETQDLDLFLHRPDDTTPWYPSGPGRTSFDPLPEASCGWHNCEAMVRLTRHPVTGAPVLRPDWGYASTPLARCENGPQGPQWAALGSCANPRLDIDNNLDEGTGVPENINVDNPRDGQTFRIMVNNYTGTIARPLVNVYCGGRRVATFGQSPDTVPGFRGVDGGSGIGAMWRVADVRVSVDASGTTTGCDVTQLHPAGTTSGYLVTRGDVSY